VFTCNHQEKDRHEWQQPLEEVELMVRYFSKPGELVCDPCGGSFTTALAARNLGRRFVGCDIEQSCVVGGQARLKETAPPGSAKAG
jgi:site-specific DNA-methyltransferase (adenine-specific)